MSFWSWSLWAFLQFSSSSVNLKLNFDDGVGLVTKGFLVGGGPPPDGPEPKALPDEAPSKPKHLSCLAWLLCDCTWADLTSMTAVATVQNTILNLDVSIVRGDLVMTKLQLENGFLMSETPNALKPKQRNKGMYYKKLIVNPKKSLSAKNFTFVNWQTWTVYYQSDNCIFFFIRNL